MFELGDAARAGDVARVKTLLREGVQVNSRDSGSRTALQYACESEHKDMQRVVDVLLDAGADVNAQGEDGQTPLHIAVQRISFQTKLENNVAGDENEETPLAISSKRNEVLVKTLLREGAMVNVRDRKMRTALHWACMYIWWVKDDKLLEAGAKTNIQIEKGQTPLHVAIDNNEIVKALLTYSTNESSKERSSQHLVDHPQDEDKVRMVNSQDEDGNTALHLACMAADNASVLQCVRLLLCEGAKVGVKNNDGRTALHMAAFHSRADIVDLLLNNGEDVNDTDNIGDTPLHMASFRGKNKIVRLLLSKGAKVGVKNTFGKTALQEAASNGKAGAVDILFNNGEDVNATNNNGDTPLHGACWTGFPILVRLLLSKGAKVGVKNNAGETALHFAARQGRAEIVDILLNNGEDINATDKLGNTPLHAASHWDIYSYFEHYGYLTETVRLLYRKGAKVGVKDEMGKTPLHKAAASADGDTVNVILDHGENVRVKDRFGNTPLHYVGAKPHEITYSEKTLAFIINLLIIRGAKIDQQNIHGENPHDKIKASRDYRMETVETTLITQAIRLKTLGLQDKFDISWIFGQAFYNNVKLQCCQELESMKSTMVVKDISLYQVLSHISQSFLVSTEDLQHIDDFLSSPDLLTRFPLYGDTLRITFQRAKLLTLAVQSFYSERRKQMMKKLPCEVAEQLVNFLSNNDLRMFIESE